MKAHFTAPHAAAKPVAARSNRIALPHAAAMQRRFGPRVAHMPVFAGPSVAAILATRKADAAALGGAIFLKDSRAPAEIVAHELAHALQQYRLGDDVSSSAMLHALAVAPVLPAASPAEAEAQAIAAAPGPAAPAQALAPGVVALRRTPAAPTERVAPDALAQPAIPAEPAQTARAEASVALAPSAPAEPTPPTFALPEAPDTTLDLAIAEARATAAAAAQAAIAAATTPSAAMAVYATLAPSQKGRAAAGLGATLGETAAGTIATLIEATPEIAVGIDAIATPLPEPVPLDLTARSGALVPDAAPAIITIPDAPAQPVLNRPQNVARTIEQRFADGASQDGIFATIHALRTENPGVVTSITDRAEVPLAGDTDMALLDSAAANTGVAAAGAQGDAADAIVAGRGPEAVMPRSLGHVAALPTIETRPNEALAPPPEAAGLERLALPAEVVAGFDAASAAQMATSTAAAQAAMAKAEGDQQTAHATALKTAETGRAAAETDAQTGQHDIVVAQRQAIQGERQRTVTAQADAVAGVEAEAETARHDHHGKVETQVAADGAAIDAEYEGAETRAAAKVAEAERHAVAAREQADRDAANQSWWDRAASFIGDVFDALVSLIGDLFDAVRSAVGAILTAVGDVVKGLIDRAASAIKGLISALGEVLKLIVDGLIGTIFPELAARLNGYVAAAVSAANSAVDAVADRLKAAVDAAVTALHAAINSLLDVFQGAINAALALAQAALTGDWSGLLTKVLDAILSLLGIDPAAFHALIAQAANAIETIVNDPAAFVGNLLDAVTGGIQRFIDNFGTRLQQGIIAWLTGALGNITLPERWDLAGVLDLARQVTGLTWDFVRERATRLIGAANVARLEIAFDWIATLVTEGFPALFQRIYNGLNDLTGGVLEAIRSFLVERVLMGAITWLASIFNPVGAIVKLVMTIWNIYQFLKNQLARIMAIVTSVVRSIADIAAGKLEPAIAAIDGVLGNLLPVAIDLLMSLLGVSGVAARVREILQMVRDRIATSIDALIGRVVAAFRGEFGLAAGAPAAANDNAAEPRLGHPVRVDVANGPDHMLSIDRGGPGGATVMLRSDPLPLKAWLMRLDPLVERISVAATKEEALKAIESARKILDELEIAADRAASANATLAETAAETAAKTAAKPAKGAKPAVKASIEAVGALVATETRLATVVAIVFEAVGGAGGQFADLYADNILRTHEKARDMIRQDLRRDAAKLALLASWTGVSAALMIDSELCKDPLDGGRIFGETMRKVIESAIDPVAPATTKDPAEVAQILTYCRQQVRASDGEAFKALRTALHAAIFSVDVPVGANVITDAIAAARADLNASNEVDAQLRAAIHTHGLQKFLLLMAQNATVDTGAGDKIGPVGFNILWHKKTGAGRANRDFIASRFRSPEGLHEWIPTNFIPEVLARARRAEEEEGIEYAALWVAVHHAWRTKTELLIFEPSTGYVRKLKIGEGKQEVEILQGHVGAIYAKADETGVIKDPQQQTIGQPEWHENLRDIFMANAKADLDSRAALISVIRKIDSFAQKTIWAGKTPVKGFDPNIFDGYCSSTGKHLRIDEVKAVAEGAFEKINKGFEAARAVATMKVP
jgi:hypothetical protein